jgi:hypothetical protein
MKALTICQPYAELIARGEKRIENRKWATYYTGPLAIHAGRSRAWLKTYRPLPENMTFGAVVAIARLVACVRLALANDWLRNNRASHWLKTTSNSADYGWIIEHKHAEGPWLWILDDVRRLAEPIPCSGQQGLREWTPDRPLEFA